MVLRRRRRMHGRIHVPVQGGGAARAQHAFQLAQGRAPGVTQHQFVVAQAALVQPRHRLPGRQRVQRHRRIQVVEDAQRARGFQQGLARGQRIGAIGSDDRGIGVGQLALGARADGRPVRIQDQAAVFGAPVARLRIPWGIVFEEHHAMAELRQRGVQPAPERRVAVAPRGGDAQAEHDQLHAAAASRGAEAATSAPSSQVIRVTEAAGTWYSAQ